MEEVLRWISMDNDPRANALYKSLLWGYPDLITKLFEVVRPALIEEREKRRELEEEWQRGRTVEHVKRNHEIMEEIKDSTTSTPQQCLSVPSDDGSGPLDLTQTVACPDSQAQPIKHPTTSNGYLSTVSTSTMETLKPFPGIQTPQSDTGEAANLPNVIEEVPGSSTPDANNEELSVVQR